MIKFKQTAIALGYGEKQIIISHNGEITEIENGNNNGPVRKISEVGQKIIEKTANSSISGTVLEERMSLGKTGLVSISVIVDKQTKEPISKVDIQMRGVVFVKGQDRMINKIEKTVLDLLEESKQAFNASKLTKILNKEVTKVIRGEIKIAPLMVVNILEK